MLVNSLFRSGALRSIKPSNGAIFTKSSIHNSKRNHILKQIPKSPTPNILFTRSFSNAVTYKNTSAEYAQMLSRTHKCGDISLSHIGEKVRLCGWVSSKRNMGKLLFIVLRDMHGSVQVTFDLSNATPELEKQVNDLSIECVISIEGTVRARPADMVNPQMKTGQVEVLASDHHLLNTCDLIPFDIRDEKLANEEVRFKYRFLDLRRTNLQNNLKIRSQICHTIRNYLVDQGFLEIETPTLFKKTVESGAKEFLVPTRTIGKFYALPQSPQQYKQLLMAGGIDKYFQLARCYRDEGTKPDRQPEFTQVDMEMSFITPENIYQVIEGILKNVWKKSLNIDLKTPFLRMRFDEAIARYGVDKPDTRYEMEISDVTDLVKNSQVSLFSNLGAKDKVKIINIKGLAKNCTQKELEFLQNESKLMHEKGSIQIRVLNGEWKSPIAKHLSESEKKSIADKVNVEDGDLLVMAIGPQLQSCTVLGRVRTQAANMLQSKGMLEIPSDKFNFMWVIDFPLFSLEPDLCSTHHPFTAPYTEDIPLLDSKDQDDLLKIRALHYDIVCNGVELGGGSIRIHDHLMQRKVFNIINVPNEGVQQFQHLLEALRYGCPPHGGIALGLDRLVAMVCKAHTLREVIAFPKTATGAELMSGAPSEISAEELKEFGLAYTPEALKVIKKRSEN